MRLTIGDDGENDATICLSSDSNEVINLSSDTPSSDELSTNEEIELSTNEEITPKQQQTRLGRFK